MLAVIRTRSEQRLRQLDRFSVRADLRRAGIRRADPVLISVVACIEQIEIISVSNRGARVRSLVVEDPVRLQTDAFVRPVDEIFRRYMIPVLQSVDCSPRAPLIIQMPHALVIDKAVRITGQTCDRHNMIRLTIDRFENAAKEISYIFRAFKYAISFF